jgi:hypothetical protein
MQQAVRCNKRGLYLEDSLGAPLLPELGSDPVTAGFGGPGSGPGQVSANIGGGWARRCHLDLQSELKATVLCRNPPIAPVSSEAG